MRLPRKSPSGHNVMDMQLLMKLKKKTPGAKVSLDLSPKQSEAAATKEVKMGGDNRHPKAADHILMSPSRL